jgi:hypothetical protein
VGLVVGLLQMLKAKKMNAVPFRRPSEIAQLGPGAADAKGMVSTEGQVQPGPQPLHAPMSGEPCLAYEIVVERKWEKHVQTEKGMQKKTGSERVFSDTKGSLFQITDGAGAIMVDSNGTIDADMDKSHSSKVPVGITMPGTLVFGRFQMNTPLVLNTDTRTTGYEATEKVVRPSAQVYALGKLDQGAYGPTLATPAGIGTGKLILSSKGRAQLLGKTKRNMILGYALGGVFFVGGTALGIFGPAPEPSAHCPSLITDTSVATAALSCDDRLYDKDGKDFSLQIGEKGTYRIAVKQPAGLAHPIDATVTLTDATGKQVAYNDGGSPGAEAKVEQALEPGSYKINVRDFARSKVEGGYSFSMSVEKIAAPAAPAVADKDDDDGDKPGKADLTSAKIAAKPGAAAKPAAAAVKPAANGAATGAAKPADKAGDKAGDKPADKAAGASTAAATTTATAAKPAGTTAPTGTAAPKPTATSTAKK